MHLLLLTVSLQAQVVLTTADLPQPGDSLLFATDTTTSGLTAGPAGANQLWDFSQLQADEQFGLRFLDPATIPGSDQFPSATVALQTDQVIVSGDLSGYVFNEYRDTGLFVLGGLVESPEIETLTPAFFESPQRLVELPTNFATSYVDESRLVLSTGAPDADSVRYVFDRRMEVTVDSWGTLRLPAGDLSALRQRIETRSRDSVYVKSTEGIWELVRADENIILEYQWMAQESKGLALLMQFNDAGIATSVTYFVEASVIVMPPEAAFSVEELGAGTFRFTDASTNQPTRWSWDFEDGATSTAPNPEHTFEEAGTYSVCLTVGNDAGESTYCQEIIVTLAPVAAFRAENLEQGRFRFVDESTNEPSSWSWDFGDGATSTEQNPEHTFAGPGTYQVCLTVGNAAGSNEVCQAIDIGAPPVAAFDIEYLGDGRFRFLDRSTNGPTVWSWDFGDGVISKDQNPEHEFKEPGVYEVCLFVSNDAGGDRLCKNVIVGAPPEAAFRIEAEALGRYRFIDESTNGPTSWNWDFGDGATSEQQNPRHTFNGSGTYSVCLAVSNDSGEDIRCQDLIVVLPPEAAFQVEELGDGRFRFTDESTNAPSAWRWDFGDGNSSEEQHPEHEYTAPGDYNICLTASNAAGADQFCQTVSVAGAVPMAAFRAEPLGDGRYRFVDESTNNPSAWSWDFGDGASSTAQNPEHTYEAPGEYQVCLQVSNAEGAGEACLLVRVRLAPAAAFNFENVEGGRYRFTDRSTNRPTSWRWDFGDGNSSTEQDPEHTFAAPGEYTVCLTATNDVGTDEHCRTLTVGEEGTAPVAAFRFEDEGLGIFRFIDESTNDPAIWSWDFGDGGVSKQQSPEYVFFNPGEYRVCLTVSNEAGTDEICQVVTVVLPPRVFFSAEALEPGTFQFRDQSINEPTSWRWDFGDGNTSEEQSPQHTYAEAGRYTVCLWVENAAGTDEDCNYVEVVLEPKPAFDYLVDQATVEFTDRTTNGPTAWSWKFGDGASSEVQHPSHTYAEAGTYRVCLTASNDNGSAQTCRDIRIAMAPEADFSFSIDQGTVSFADASTNAPTNWKWDFGDGASSTQQNPTHIYDEPGDYTVCLTAGNEYGSGESCKAFTIVLAPAAAFQVEALGGGRYQFRDQSRNEPASWRWDFGDGNTSTTQSPQHSYRLSGDYEVCLTVENEIGTDQICQAISALVAPEAIFTFELQEDGAVRFTDLSTNAPTSWRWDFGDGNTSAEQYPEHAYGESGVYEVCLTAANEAGDHTSCDQLDITLTSIAPLNDGRILTAFPNPASERITFALPQNQTPLLVVVRDPLGRVRHQFLLLHQEEVAVQHWAAGVYFYQVFDAGGRPLSSGQLIVGH